MREIDKIDEEIGKLADMIAERIGLIVERKVVDVIDEKGKVATGELRRSISHEVLKKVNEYVVRVFSGVKYAVFVHEGTKPHFPPIEPIAKWIVRKGIGTSKIRKRRSISRAIADQEVRKLAFAIAKSISMKGTSGVKFFEIALNRSIPEIEKEIKSVLG